MIDRICTNCKADISHKHVNAKFCTPKCKDAYWNMKDKDGVERRFWSQKKAAPEEEKIKCESCGQDTPKHDLRENSVQDMVCFDCYMSDQYGGGYICDEQY